jgi:hypothetical protein
MLYKASRLMKRGFFSMLVFLSVMLFLGCSENTPSSEGTSPETGSIALNIIMEDTQPDVGGSAIPRAMRDECGGDDPYQISWVAARVYSTPPVSGTWSCSLGGALLEDVPTGDDLRLVVIGFNADIFGFVTLYSAEARVDVVAGQTSESTIVAEAFSVNKIYPEDNATNVDPDYITFEWEPVKGADTYRIFVTDREDYDDPALVVFIDAETANTSFTYDDSLEGNTTYYWGVYPMDFDGYEGYGSVWSFTTGAGGVTAPNLTGWQYSSNSSFSVDVDAYWLIWGGTHTVYWAIRNNGTEATPPFTYVWVNFYLSDDTSFTSDDYLLFSGYLSTPLSSTGMAAGSGEAGTIPITLPTDSPFPWSSGIFYIGMDIDTENNIVESNEDDNSGTGEGVDYYEVYIEHLF